MAIQLIGDSAGGDLQDRLNKSGEFAAKGSGYGFFVALIAMVQVKGCDKSTKSGEIPAGCWYMADERNQAGSSPIHWSSDRNRIKGLYVKANVEGDLHAFVTVDHARRLHQAGVASAEFVAMVEAVHSPQIAPDAESVEAAKAPKAAKTAKSGK